MKNTQDVNVPRDEVTFTLLCKPEYISVHGNALCSGDDAQDAAHEKELLRQLDAGNEWAWCQVGVVAEWNGVQGDAWLGGCSFLSEEDFRGDLYHTSLEDEAYNNLVTQVIVLVEAATRTRR